MHRKRSFSCKTSAAVTNRTFAFKAANGHKLTKSSRPPAKSIGWHTHTAEPNHDDQSYASHRTLLPFSVHLKLLTPLTPTFTALNTHIACHSLVFLHEVFVVLVNFQHFAYAVCCRLRLSVNANDNLKNSIISNKQYLSNDSMSSHDVLKKVKTDN